METKEINQYGTAQLLEKFLPRQICQHIIWEFLAPDAKELAEQKKDVNWQIHVIVRALKTYEIPNVLSNLKVHMRSFYKKRGKRRLLSPLHQRVYYACAMQRHGRFGLSGEQEKDLDLLDVFEDVVYKIASHKHPLLKHLT